MNALHATTLALLATTGSIAAQTWTQATPTSSPPAQGYQQSLVYDFARQQMVMYGGRTTAVLGDTWTYSGGNWSLSPAAPAPGLRWAHRMVYDYQRARIVLFAGRNASNVAQNDTWAFDGTTWTQIPTPTAPPARAWHVMAYDTRRDRIVTFGGFGVLDTQTWEFDGSSWAAVPTAHRPPVVSDGQMVYDEGRGVCVLYGGWDGLAAVYADTWEFDGVDWRQVITANTPTQRVRHTLSYDYRRHHVVLHGGYGGTTLTDTWTYDGNDWTFVSPTGTAPNVPVEAAMAYDIGNDVHVHFGGRGPTGTSGGTFEYRSLGYPSYALAGRGCAGSAGTPLLEAAPGSRPVAGGTFTARVSNLPASAGYAVVFFGLTNIAAGPLRLPFDLTGLGITGCTLHCASNPSFAVPASGGTASWTLSVPAAVAGAAFWNQVLVADPGTNPIGVVLSNACRGYVDF
ncbi:MAG: hypothetical protein IPM29_10595 [Planctomycetes bacterium]|nr:hypothetical protein [Planctomycetota bacterium]